MSRVKACYYCRSMEDVILVLDSIVPGSSVFACAECRSHLSDSRGREKSGLRVPLRDHPGGSRHLIRWLVPHMVD